MISYLKHSEIDKTAYDACVSTASNETVYAYSWYLDIVAPNWSLLVLDNYKMVMPLPARKKLGLRYVFVPWFTQQLGLFGDSPNAQNLDEFLNAIPTKFKLIDIKLSEQNTTKQFGKNCKNFANYLLELEKDYAQTSKKYNRNCRRNIKKAQEAALEISGEINAAAFAAFIARHLDKEVSALRKSDILTLENLVTEGIHREKCELIAVKNQDGEIYAAASFFFAKERIIFSVCASSPEGKKAQAMALLVDHQVQTYAGKFRYFDFSGSQIKGIAYFNSTFGALPVSYAYLSINRMNRVLKILARKF